MATKKKTTKRLPATVTHTREDGSTQTLRMPPTRTRATFKRRRPRGDEPFTSVLKVKVTAAELEATRRLAALRSQTPSALVRELVARELAAAFPVSKAAAKPSKVSP